MNRHDVAILGALGLAVAAFLAATAGRLTHQIDDGGYWFLMWLAMTGLYIQASIARRDVMNTAKEALGNTEQALAIAHRQAQVIKLLQDRIEYYEANDGES